MNSSRSYHYYNNNYYYYYYYYYDFYHHYHYYDDCHNYSYYDYYYYYLNYCYYYHYQDIDTGAYRNRREKTKSSRQRANLRLPSSAVALRYNRCYYSEGRRIDQMLVGEVSTAAEQEV